jgi:hypothetical protein
MMRLVTAARLGDTTALVDAFDSSIIVMGQFDLFDDSRRDGFGVERRIFSVAPGVEIPLRRALLEQASGDVWMVGAGQPDYWRGAEIRRKYVLHRATGSAQLRTPAQVLAASGGTSTYASPSWIKDVKQITDASTAPGVYDVFIPNTENTPDNTLIDCGGKLFWVRGSYQSSGQFLVAEAEIVDAPVMAAHHNSTYVAIDDATTEASTACTVLTLRWQACYRNDSIAALSYDVGDKVIVVAKTDAPNLKPGNKFLIGGKTYAVISVDGDADTWWAQGRLA